jgi:O-antigen ligase
MGIRLELWKRTLPIIASAPLLGHGLGQWPTQFQAEVKDFSDYDLFKMGHPHQEALLILAEQGALGLAIFVALLIGLGRYIARLSSPQHDFFASLLLIYITAGLANCLWVVFAHRNVFMLLLACIPLLPKTDLTKFSPSSA